jgi:tetratricopeptide (TPR) repeat protein
MSMGYYKMSSIDKYKEDYPDAFNNSLKYLSKYAKLDKTKESGAEYGDFFIDIRKSIISEAEIMNDQQKYTKSKALYKYLTDLDANDAGAFIMQGMTFVAIKSKKEAETAFKTAKELLSTDKCSVSDKDQKAFLKNALIEYANSLNSQSRKSEAVEWLNLGKKHFEDDKEFQVNYSSIVG